MTGPGHDDRGDAAEGRHAAIARLVTIASEELGTPVTFVAAGATPSDAAGVVDVAVAGPGGEALGALRYTSTRRGGGGAGDRRFLTTIARFLALQLAPTPDSRSDGPPVSRLRDVLDRGTLAIALQPVVDLRTGDVVGVEALARFPDGEPPDRWFAEAARAGLGLDLELLAMARALEALPAVPRGAYLSLNCSPSTAVSPRLARLLASAPMERLLLEITEHAEVGDYDRLNAALSGLRGRGLRLAIDDAGSGFASLRHILRLAPDVIKLDSSLTRGIDRDSVLRALAFSLTAFASATDATVVAEGVENEQELRALQFLQIAYAQGFALARPAPSPVPERVAVPGLSPSSAA